MILLERVSAACKFSIIDGVCNVDEDCTEKDNGYNIDDTGKFVVNYIYGSSCTLQTTPGFYVLVGEDNYAKCTAKDGCASVSKPSDVDKTSCTQVDDGKLVLLDNDNVVLCTKINQLKDDDTTDTNKYTAISFTNSPDTTDRYLIHRADGVFNFDAINAAYYVVKTTTTSITYDGAYPNVDNQCADTSGKLQDRKTDFCSPNSSGMYYTCKKGKCVAEEQNDASVKEEGLPICHCHNESVGIAASSCNSATHGYYWEDSEKLYEYSSVCSEATHDASGYKLAAGYYFNANNYKSVVMCTGSNCSQFDSVTSCSGAHQLLDTNFSLQYCLSSDLSVPFISLDGKMFVEGVPGTPFSDNTKSYALKYDADNNKIIIDSSVNGNYLRGEKLLVCTNGLCTANSSATGYYYNAENNDGYVLIYCADSKCSEKTVDNGYYLHEDNEATSIIECANSHSKCILKSLTSQTDCSTGKYTIVNINNALNYCNGSVAVAMSDIDADTTAYYVVENVKSSLHYPNDFLNGSNNTNKMVLKVTQYMIEPYVNSRDGGICITNTNTIESPCKSGSTKYICSNPNSNCSYAVMTNCIPEGTTDQRKACSGYYLSNAKKLLLCAPNISNPSIVDCSIKESVGYFVNADLNNTDKEYIKCTSTTTGTGAAAVTTINCITVPKPTSTSCSAAGNLILVDGHIKLCKDTRATNAITAFETGITERIVLPVTFWNPNAVANAYYVLIRDENAVIPNVFSDYTQLLQDQKILKCSSENSFCTFTQIAGFYLVKDKLSDPNETKLAKCDSNGQCAIPVNSLGFFVNAISTSENDKYIKCYTNNGSNVICNFENFSSLDGNCNRIGKLINDETVKLCLDTDSSNAINVLSTDLTAAERSAFNLFPASIFYTSLADDKLFVLDLTSDSVQPRIFTTVESFLHADKVLECTNTDNSCKYTTVTGKYLITGADYVIDCNGDTCEKYSNSIGYYVNGLTRASIPNAIYIKCTTTDGTNVACTGLAAPSASKKTCVTAGELIYVEEGIVKLCVDGANSIEIFSNLITKDYFIPANIFNRVLSDKQYFIADNSITSAVYPKDLSGDDRHYKYTKLRRSTQF